MATRLCVIFLYGSNIEAVNYSLKGAVGGYGLGGGILSDKSQVTLDRVKIVKNTALGGNSTSSSGKRGATGGGGGYLTSFSSTGSYLANLTNCLIAENTGQFAQILTPVKMINQIADEGDRPVVHQQSTA